MRRRKKKKNPSGEYWIDHSGCATYADGDVGDQGHEILAFGSAIGLDSDLVERLSFDRDIEISPNSIDREGLGELYAEEHNIEVTDDTDLFELGDKWLIENGADMDFVRSGEDARTYMIRKENWIRVAGNSFQMSTFDDEAIERIRHVDQLWDEEDVNGIPIEESEEEVSLEDSTGIYTVMLKDLFDPSATAERLKMLAGGNDWRMQEIAIPVFRSGATTDTGGQEGWRYRRLGENPRRARGRKRGHR